MEDEILYQLSLSAVPHIGPVHAKILVNHLGSASAVFKTKKSLLEKMEGIGEIRARSIGSFNHFSRAEEEIAFIKKYKIIPLFITDKNYPQRLLNCYDPPTILFYKGNTDLNASKMVAIVGTRTNSDYGKHVTEKLIKDLSSENVLIISGLAFGIDAIAHKAALKNNLQTIGVVAHGLDSIYPFEHAGLAKNILKQGGLLTEFMSGTKPDRHNFPGRNRIVAGMSDATVVVETSIKGGSMITAELADGYNREVFALPGKITDTKSTGCNHLIKNNKAVLLTDAQQLIELMGWEPKQKVKNKKQKELFIELSADEKIIIELLNEKNTLHIDELHFKSGLSSSSMAAAILNLELQNIVTSLPGKMYALNS